MCLHLLDGFYLGDLPADIKLLMADCAFKLNKFDDVERICVFGSRSDLGAISSMFGILTAPVLRILGDSFRRRNRKDQAIECYRRCMLSAPYMISALQALAELDDSYCDRYGELLTTNNVRKLLSSPTYLQLEIIDRPVACKVPRSQRAVPDIPDENEDMGAVTNRCARPLVPKRPSSGEALKALAPKVPEEQLWPGPVPGAKPPASGGRPSMIPVQQKRTKVSSLLPRKSRRLATSTRCASKGAITCAGDKSDAADGDFATDDPCCTKTSVPKLLQRSLTDSAASKDSGPRHTDRGGSNIPRMSRGPTTRLQHRQRSLNAVNKAAGHLSSSCSSGDRPCSHPICKLNDTPQCSIVNSNKCTDELVQALSHLYSIYVRMQRNKFNETLAAYDQLPTTMKSMHWTLMQKAIAQTEMGQYTSAVSTFKRIRLHYPMHLQSMAIYSTALWHLRAQNDLVNLAQVLSEVDLHHPAVWCAIGNHYSMSAEHDIAIQMFKRALQLNANYRYALALLGNEYMVSDNHELATTCFRILLHRDIRDYRAWYGLGSICFAREKYQQAQSYFERALSVNPSSTVLMCHVAVTKHIRGYSKDALDMLTEAVSIDPNNSLCRFHKVGLLYTLNFLSDALKELKILEELVPNESLVFHMLARVYRRMKNEQLFLAHVNWAMKLDRKRTHITVKDSIDRFYAKEDDQCMDDHPIGAFAFVSPATEPPSVIYSTGDGCAQRVFRSAPLGAIEESEARTEEPSPLLADSEQLDEPLTSATTTPPQRDSPRRR